MGPLNRRLRALERPSLTYKLEVGRVLCKGRVFSGTYSPAFREQLFSATRIQDRALTDARRLPGTSHHTARHGTQHYI
jgi:hypothetical protein